MSDLNYILATVWQVVKENPARFVPVLAYACGITLVMAIMTDAFLARRRTHQKKRHLAGEPRPR